MLTASYVDNEEAGKLNLTVIYLITHCQEFKYKDNLPL